MKTRLAQKPLIREWMSPAAKKFRRDFPNFIERLPDYSFLDKKSFKIDGYFVGQNVGSVVLKVKDKHGVYVVKSLLDPQEITTEAAFLEKWRKIGADTIKVFELVTSKGGFPITAAILEYIPKMTTEEELENKKGKNKVTVYRKLGQSLTVLHKAKGTGFGQVVTTRVLKGRYKTFGQERNAVLTLKRQRTLIASRLIRKEDLALIPRAIKIVENDIKRSQPSLIHGDPGLFNTFGTASLKFFDPDPKVSHPLEDVAIALIWASLEEKNPKVMRSSLVAGYKSKQKYNDSVLQAVLFLKLLEKWEWWLHRGKSDKYALGWIRKTKGIFADAKKQLETV